VSCFYFCSNDHGKYLTFNEVVVTVYRYKAQVDL
jgi:hypothetical protein